MLVKCISDSISHCVNDLNINNDRKKNFFLKVLPNHAHFEKIISIFISFCLIIIIQPWQVVRRDSHMKINNHKSI